MTPTQTLTRTSTATATSGIRTFTVTAAADSYVNQSSPTTNYGTSTQLRVDGSPFLRSYLRFNVQNVTGRITRVTLRIFASSAAGSGCVANIVSNNTWTETSLTYNNAPPLGSPLGSSGSFGAGVWITMDVTAYITGNGTYSIAVTTPGSTAVSLASREASANPPQLIIETGP
jgi:acid phosphatase type 7